MKNAINVIYLGGPTVVCIDLEIRVSAPEGKTLPNEDDTLHALAGGLYDSAIIDQVLIQH